VRRLGQIAPVTQLNPTDGRRAMSYIKAISGLDLAEHRRPLDGRWIFVRASGQRIDLRINTLPTLYGEDFTLRILDRDTQLRTMDALGLTRRQVNDVAAMLNSTDGLILVTGPTGAGKTTTLYAFLNYLNDGKRKINTIEDPIEYALPGVRQSQVHSQIEVDFPELLRSVLRQSPDVILIGEIRDALTAQTAIRAANSGHLVFATLHAGVAGAAVQSMFGWDVGPLFVSTCLRGVITQRLIRTLCPECKAPIDMRDAPLAFDEVRQWLEPGQGDAMYAHRGCPKCLHTGYAGRTGLFEIMPITRRIRGLIAAQAPAASIESEAIAEGMIEFRRGGLLHVASGKTSAEEIIRVVPPEHLGVED
jgi:type II secretory ATPase GspE/PulE/Tfp pilus assembly ATPase PilB-like protein